MATGGRLRYWVSSCFVLIAFHVLFLELIGEKKPTNRYNPSFTWKDLMFSQCTGQLLMSPFGDVGVLYLNQVARAPGPLVAKTLFLPFPA